MGRNAKSGLRLLEFGAGAVFTLILLAAPSFAQGEGSGAIKTKDGFLIVSNEPGNFYTMEIKGREIKPIPNRPFWFTVDGKFLQVVNAEQSQFLKPDDPKSPADAKEVLSQHMKWESDYIAQTLGAKLQINSHWLSLANGLTAISWDYDMPHVDPRQTAQRQLYLVVINGNHVVGLNTVVEKDGEEKTLQQYLIATLGSLKPRDKPLSLEDASKAIRQAIY